MNTEPAFLYRAFDQKEYAIQFLEHGKFRLGLLINYRKIEDEQRRDKSEGESSTYIKTNLPTVTLDKRTMEITSTSCSPGLLHFGGARINPMYLMCTSGPDADLDHIRNRWKHVVKINAPMMLLNDMNSSKPVDSKMEFTGKCFLERVRYTKDQIQELDPESTEALKLSYLQKHPRFLNECEYRYIVTADCVKGEPEDFIWYDLNRRLDYLEII